MKEKPKIRREIKSEKLKIDEGYRYEASLSVMNKIESLKQFNEAKRVLLYNALPDELPTECMLNRWSKDKELFLPVVKGEELVIKKYSPECMKVGAFGIKEPEGEEINIETIDIIIVPGVAFDREHNRLGRGKGFYDRLLSQSKSCFVGIGYDIQVIDSVPTQPHDIKMNYIITEREIL